MNSDGKSDLVASNRGDDNIALLRGTGGGAFGAAHYFSAGPSPLGLLQGDWNGDGRNDLAVANSATPGRVAILPRKPGVDFGGPLRYPVGPEPYGLAVGRLNGDNRLDVATANYTGTTSVLQGN